ncbi:MAG: hypothetical protein QXW41_08605 [Fervidicoccaceae archaeon]
MIETSTYDLPKGLKSAEIQDGRFVVRVNYDPANLLRFGAEEVR